MPGAAALLYRVTAPLVMIPVEQPGGVTRFVGVVQGAILPDGVEPDRIAHLLSHQLVEPVTDGHGSARG